MGKLPLSTEVGVVVADQRHVLGHPQAEVVRGRQRPDGRDVVEGEDRGGPVRAGEQPAGRGVAALLAHATRLQVRVGVQPGRPESAAVALRPQPTDLLGAGEVPDPGVAQLQQVRGGGAGPGEVVVHHDVDVVEVGIPGSREHHRDAGSGRADRLLLGVRPDDHERVDVLGEQGGDRADADPVVGPAVGEDGGQARAVQGGRQPGEQVDEPGVGKVVQQHADRVGAAARECPGARVRTIAELGHGRLDRAPAGLADPAVPLQHQRDQRLRDAGAARHVPDRRRPQDLAGAVVGCRHAARPSRSSGGLFGWSVRLARAHPSPYAGPVQFCPLRT
jgi:hypothetical protein